MRHGLTVPPDSPGSVPVHGRDHRTPRRRRAGRWDVPVPVRYQRAQAPRAAAGTRPDTGTPSVQPRPAKSGGTPPDDSFLISSQTFHAALAVTGITDGAGPGFKRIREELRTARR